MNRPLAGFLLAAAFIWFAPGFVPCAGAVAGQKSQADQGKILLQQARYSEAEEIFRGWVSEDPRNAEAHYYLALSRALQGNLDPALSGFQEALILSPGMADACFEIGSVYLRKKEHREALLWVERGLQLEPGSEYGLDLAGTLNFLLGAKIEALRYWNRLGRPHLTELHISSATQSNRQQIADEIDLKPGSLLSRLEIEKARWRLRQHDYIRSVSFLPVPGPRPDEYSLDVLVDARRKFGTFPEFLANTITGIGFGTYRLTYWNLADKGVTINLPLRWKPEARLAQLELRAPRPGHLRVYAVAAYTWRDESWNLNPSLGPDAPVARLRLHEFAVSALVPIRAPRLSIRIELAARRRTAKSQSGGVGASSGAPGNLSGAAGMTFSRAQDVGPTWQRVFWLRMTPRADLLDRRSITGWGWESHLQAGVDFGQIKDPQKESLSRISVSWESRLDRWSKAGLQSTLRFGIHAGRLSPRGVLEDHFLLGVGPDARFQLRAHPLFQDGRFGSTPLAGSFILGNLTIAHDLFTWKWVRLGAVIFCDAAYMPRLYADQALRSTAVDTGAGLEFGLTGIPSARFTLAYGHDWQRRRDVVYLSTSFR